METIEQRIQQVVGDREHGSRWLVKEALNILADLTQQSSTDAQPAQQLQQIYRSAYEIAQARPAMAALSSAMSQAVSVYEQGIEGIAQEIRHLQKEADTTIERLVTYTQPLISGQIMTCSISGTVVEVLTTLREQIERVIVLEGRPRYEGRSTAQILSERGIAVTLITDAQANIFLPDCQSVIVGADSLLINGDVLNKAGTALLAWAAHGQNIPFYVLCETLKISPQRWHEHDPAQKARNLALLEEKEPEEVFATPPEGVSVRNFYFDRTPYRLVEHVISEQGILDRRQIRARAVTIRTNQRLLAKLQKDS